MLLLVTETCIQTVHRLHNCIQIACTVRSVQAMCTILCSTVVHEDVCFEVGLRDYCPYKASLTSMCSTYRYMAIIGCSAQNVLYTNTFAHSRTSACSTVLVAV